MGSKKKASKRKAPALKAKPKVRAKKKVAPKSQTLILVNLKITRREREEIGQFADKYAGGNVSAWLRHAGRFYRPKKTEVIR